MLLNNTKTNDFLNESQFVYDLKIDYHQTMRIPNMMSEVLQKITAFLLRDRDHPVTVPSLGVLNRPTSLSVLNRSKASLTILKCP